MKTRLLKKLRKQGRDKINIYSTTTTNGVVTGMSIAFRDSSYGGLFEYGDTKEDVMKKAEHVYILKYIEQKKLHRS